VSTETIAETLQIEDPQECADRLVELALRGGGPDNVTVIVADVVNARVGDNIDGVPVIDGAFVDPAAAEVPGSADSAAERAAQLRRPPPSEPAKQVDRRRRPLSWKRWLIAGGVLALIIAGLGGFYAWTQTQYFVGRAGADVAIYQGVNTEFGPLKFFNVYKVINLPLADLNPSVRSQVQDGITASSEKDAEAVVSNLRRQQLLPACRPAPSPTPTPSPTPSRTPASTHSPTAHTTSRARTSHHASASRLTHTTSAAPTTSASVVPVPITPSPTCPVPLP
jgi:protein phosphatase